MNDMNLAASSTFIGRVLLVSDDAIAVKQLSESMQRFALSVEHCTEVSSALERLKRSKFAAVIVDFQIGSQAGTVLQETRQSASNEHAALFSVSDNPKPLMRLRLVQLSCYGDIFPPHRLT